MKIGGDAVQVVDVELVWEKKCTCREQQLSVTRRFGKCDKNGQVATH